MFYFLKVFAGGLAALALVRAAPPVISCSLHFGTPVSTEVALRGILEEGVYKIVNIAKRTPLLGGNYSQPIFAAPSGSRGDFGDLGRWKLEHAVGRGPNTYTISNVGLNAPVIVDSKDRVLVSSGATDAPGGDPFTILYADEQGTTYSIAPADIDGDEEFVWSIERKAGPGPVMLSAMKYSSKEQVWRFELIEEDAYGEEMF
ncbi:hypothetical protein FB451DRAFT_1226015 [Mycena latifolia]|nr:hypothetical protein FB451DRAFT_1226015 [Mycena latifolia]